MTAEYAEISGPFIPLINAESLAELFTRSNDVPVILFKHSLTCSISSTAYREMQRLKHDVSLIVLQNSRDVSVEVEKRTGIRHESPQVIVVRHGTAVWNASHWSITADAVERAVLENV